MNKEIKTTKEMFENLGYFNQKKYLHKIVLISNISIISIYIQTKTFSKTERYTKDAIPITTDELKAINKFYEEQGW